MHEHGLIRGVLVTAQKSLREQGVEQHVRCVHIKAGELLAATAEHLGWHFDQIKAEWPQFAAARINVEIVEGSQLFVDSMDLET